MSGGSSLGSLSVILTFFIVIIFSKGFKSVKNRIIHNLTELLGDREANIVPFAFLVLVTGHGYKQTFAAIHNLNAGDAEHIGKRYGNHSAAVGFLVIDREDTNIRNDGGSGLSRIGGLSGCFLVSVHN
nr:MAG TPA: hypothetical protein [Caudoviricetes sp.]